MSSMGRRLPEKLTLSMLMASAEVQELSLVVAAISTLADDIEVQKAVLSRLLKEHRELE